MSPKQDVNEAPIAAPAARALALVLWAWMAAAVVAGFASWRFGAERDAIAGAAALALAPAFLGFVLLPRLGRFWDAAALILAWNIAGVGLVAGTGGAFSPLTVTFLAPCALCAFLGTPRLWLAASVAPFGYAIGALVGTTAPPMLLGPWAPLMGAAALALSGALITLRPLANIAPPQRRPSAERVAAISHELRTPLTHILGFAEMIQSKIFGPLDDRYVEYAGLIRTSGGHLLDLVNGLLDLSKIDAGRYELEYETFDAREIAHEVMRLSAGGAEPKRITLAEDAPDEPLMVRADARALRQMLTNTVGNAIKFTPEGGRVRLSLRAAEEGFIADTADNGPGIPEEDRARLGAAYARGAGVANVEGTGLGLALVRALARLHGGTLSFHEAPEGGALVRITMPVLAKAA